MENTIIENQIVEDSVTIEEPVVVAKKRKYAMLHTRPTLLEPCGHGGAGLSSPIGDCNHERKHTQRHDIYIYIY